MKDIGKCVKVHDCLNLKLPFLCGVNFDALQASVCLQILCVDGVSIVFHMSRTCVHLLKVFDAPLHVL